MTNKEKYEIIYAKTLEQRHYIHSQNKRINKKTFLPQIYEIALRDFLFESVGNAYVDDNKEYRIFDLILRKLDDERIIIEANDDDN